MRNEIKVALLTAGRDVHYAYGLARAIIEKSISLDIVGGNGLDRSEWYGKSHVRFRNLRGDMREDARLLAKVSRVSVYYLRLLLYVSTTDRNIFHILWNNRFEAFDRVPLMWYYKLLGKKILLTVHNVNAGERDVNDNWFNRLTLKIQYRLADHLFVHTHKMKADLVGKFHVPDAAVSVIPFGVNNAIPDQNICRKDARRCLGLQESDKVILFFGNIAPYKGLDYLLEAFKKVSCASGTYKLLIAGRPKDCESYYQSILEIMHKSMCRERIMLRAEHIPDGEAEAFFKAADVFVLPYRYIYQSGVLFLGYNFGLPVIVTDVGALREDVIEGETGFICKPEDAADLARTIERYFASDLYDNLDSRRQKIQKYVHDLHSWDVVGRLTVDAYAKVWGGESRVVEI